jgi:hypothetical protein
MLEGKKYFSLESKAGVGDAGIIYQVAYSLAVPLGTT